MWQDPLPSGACQEHPGYHVGLLRGGRAGGEQREAGGQALSTDTNQSIEHYSRAAHFHTAKHKIIGLPY